MRIALKMILIGLVLSPVYALAQVADTIPAPKKDVANTLLAVSTPKTNILYAGLDNPIEVAICEVKSDDITVVVDNGTVTKKSNVEWILRVNKVGKVTLKVYVKKDGVQVFYSKREFRVLPVPAPVIAIGGVKSGSIEKQKIVNHPHLQAVLEDFLFEGVKYSVTTFTVTIAAKPYKCTGSKISNEALEAIKKLPAGTKISFSEIKAMGPDAVAKDVVGVSFVLK